MTGRATELCGGEARRGHTDNERARSQVLPPAAGTRDPHWNARGGATLEPCSRLCRDSSSLRSSEAGISGDGDNQGFGLVSLLPNCLCRYFLLGAAVWKKQLCVAVIMTWLEVLQSLVNLS